MSVNRTIAPPASLEAKIKLTKAQQVELANGLQLFYIAGGSEDLCKIEFRFQAGSAFQSSPLQASATNHLINHGTNNYSANELADHIEGYGAFLETSATKDSASIVLYSLNKHLVQLLPYVIEMLDQANFPEEEVSLYAKNKQQRFMVNMEKVGFLAKRQFLETIYGTHPYSRPTELSDYDLLKSEALQEFYQQFYRDGQLSIYVSGKVNDQVLQLIANSLNGTTWNKGASLEIPNCRTEHPRVELGIEKADALQSAIRIGRPFYNRSHKDYIQLQLASTVLGGYFGSRLMANIREDKGYTYGIGAGLLSMRAGGYFFIGTEVGSDVTQAALKEIYKEIDRLQTEAIPASEIRLVRNYLLGSVMKSFDGAFAAMDKFIAIREYGMDYSYYDQLLEGIQNMNAQSIQAVTNKYLQKESLSELVAGR